MKNPYQTREGRAWLRPSWVVYLDILGFVESIHLAAESGVQDEHLKRFRSALTEAKEFLVADMKNLRLGMPELPAPYVIKVFTDNIVLGFPVCDDGESEFGNMISIVGRYQYTLLKHGFFVRGGISFGDLYMDDDVVYGKGLLDAYDAEHTRARDPRIVLGPSAMAQVHTHLAWYSTVDWAPHNEHLLVDSDSQMFVNYLAIPIDGWEMGDPLPAEYQSSVEKHRDLIVSRLKEFAQTPPLWSKYAWVGTYHNLFFTEFISRGELLIAPEMLSQPARRLAEVYVKKGRHVYRDGEVVGTFKSMREYETQREPE